MAQDERRRFAAIVVGGLERAADECGHAQHVEEVRRDRQASHLPWRGVQHQRGGARAGRPHERGTFEALTRLDPVDVFGINERSMRITARNVVFPHADEPVRLGIGQRLEQ